MWFPLFRVIAASVFFAYAAAVTCLAAPPLEEISFEEAGRVVKGVRYAGKGPPVLLLHGIFENTRVWKDMGEALHAQGYDVWMINWSGHGKGDQKSTVHSPEKGDYSFESLVTKDLPMSVDRIFQITGQKVLIMGHSLGGLVAEKYVAGVTRSNPQNPKSPIVDTAARRRQVAEKVKGVVTVGSPFDFDDLPLFFKIFTRALEPLAKRGIALPVVGPDIAPTQQQSAQGVREIERRVWKLLAQVLQRSPIEIPGGVLKHSNLSREDEEFFLLMYKALSGMHPDLTKDFLRWVAHRSFDSRDGFDFKKALETDVPILRVTAEQDRLADPERTRAMVKKLRAHGLPVRSYEVPSTGHVDLILGKQAVPKLLPVLQEFLGDPKTAVLKEEFAVPRPCGLKSALQWLRNS